MPVFLTKRILKYILAKTRVQSGIRQFFGLLNSSVTNEDAVHESDRPYQSEPANTGLASLLLLQSHLDIMHATIF